MNQKLNKNNNLNRARLALVLMSAPNYSGTTISRVVCIDYSLILIIPKITLLIGIGWSLAIIGGDLSHFRTFLFTHFLG